MPSPSSLQLGLEGLRRRFLFAEPATNTSSIHINSTDIALIFSKDKLNSLKNKNKSQPVLIKSDGSTGKIEEMAENTKQHFLLLSKCGAVI